MHNPSSAERYFAIISLLFYGGAFFGLFDSHAPGDAISEDGNIVAQFIYLFIYGFTAYYSFAYYKILMVAIWNNKGLLLLFCLVFISIFLSDNPLITSRRVIALLCSSMFGYYLSIRYRLIDILQLINKSLFIGSILSIFFALFLTQHGLMSAMQEGGYHEGAWKGIYIHKNTLGRLMVIYSLTAFTLYSATQKKKYLLEIALAVFLIFMSRSSSALLLVAFIIGLSYIFRVFLIKSSDLLLVLIFVVTGIVGSAYYLMSNYEILFELLGKDPTLTGRSVLWEHIFLAIDKRPLFGYGFGGFWLNSHGAASIISQQVNWEVPNSHNGFLDILLDTGYLGLFIFSLIYASNLFLYTRSYSVQKQKKYDWGVAYMILFLVYNFVESNLLRQNNFFWILFVSTLSSYSMLNNIQCRFPSSPVHKDLDQAIDLSKNIFIN